MIPASRPISIAGIGFTNPDAGVMATRPATAPETAPRTLGLPATTHSVIIHPRTAAAVAKCVTTNALVASGPALSALPALNPNQPTHSRHAPITLSTTLCGRMDSLGYPVRFPKYRAHINAETPDVMCTTVPPAKSHAGITPPSVPERKPPLPHTM